MRQRAFISGCVAFALPIASRAQRVKAIVVGVLRSSDGQIFHPDLTLRFFFVSLLSISTCCAGAEFTSAGRHEETKQSTIIEAGNVEKLRQPSASTGREVLKLNSTCLSRSGSPSTWGSNKKAGFLLLDSGRSLKLALLELVGSSIELKVNPVSIVRCPDGSFSTERSLPPVSSGGLTESFCQILGMYRGVLSKETLLNFCILNYTESECARCSF